MEKKAYVGPYSVEGDINYDKLVDEFGLERISPSLLNRIKKLTHDLHPMLRRGIFFAHRDLNWLLNEYDKGNKFFLYTGCGPSGPIHIGHFVVWYFAKWIQDKFDVDLYFQFTDDEKFMYKDLSYEQVQKWLTENMIDVIAVGFNPKKTHFIIDTKHAGILYPEAIKIAKRITFSTVKSSFGFNESTNIGSIFFTSMQAVPVVLPSILKRKKIPCLILHAVDQDPHFRITRDILPKLGYYKPASIQCSFLPPLSGTEGKMSSSEDIKSILSTDTYKEIEMKITKYAFSGGQATLDEHRKKGGNPYADVSFQYLRYLFEEDDAKLDQIRQDYVNGKLSTGDLKKYTVGKISNFMKKHQERRMAARSKIRKFLLKI